jgi:hypothetical protein
MKLRWSLWMSWALALAGPAALAACPPTAADGTPLLAGPVQLAWRAEPVKINTGQPFALQLQLCPAQAMLTRVDATMPAHRHGMNYKASLQDLGGGLWRVDGLLWHMAGRWELRFDVQHEGSTHTLRQDVVLR